MEPPEWVHVVSHGTAEELREFIGRNPGFDWDMTGFDGRSAFMLIVEFNPFPLHPVQMLHDVGGAHLTKPIKGARSPLEIAAYLGMADMAALLIQYDVTIDSPRVLEHDDGVREMILDHSTTLTRKIVHRALEHLNNVTYWRWQYRKDSAKAIARNSMSCWLVSHQRRRDASLSAVWALSQLTGSSWPDMCEPLLKRMLKTRVRDW